MPDATIPGRSTTRTGAKVTAFSGINVGLVRDGQIAQLYTMLTAENRPSSSEE